MNAYFDRGDIARVELAPGVVWNVLVLSRHEFYRLGDALVAPIVAIGDVGPHAGFAVTLDVASCKTKGAALKSTRRRKTPLMMRSGGWSLC